VETGRIIGRALKLKPRGVANLQNLDQGLWQGLLVDEIRRKQPRLYRQWQDNPWAVAPPEGELLEEACERVERALEKILRRHGDGRVALVVPAPLDRIVRWLVAGESMGDLWARDPEEEPLVEIPVAAQWAAKTRFRRSRAVEPRATMPDPGGGPPPPASRTSVLRHALTHSHGTPPLFATEPRHRRRPAGRGCRG
jgi:broad specificity phosphatase PhoE